MRRKNVLGCAAIAVCVTTHAVLLGSGRRDPQGSAAGEKRPISIDQRRPIPNNLEEIVDPTHSAVIVHEMVRDLAAQYEPAQIERWLTPIQRILVAARESGCALSTCVSPHTPMAAPSRILYVALRFAENRGPIRPRSKERPGGMIDAVKPHPEDLVLRKYRPDASMAASLILCCGGTGFKTVVVVGLGAAVGVVPTLATASNLGYFPVAITDALISSDAKRTADAQAYVTDTSLVTTHTGLLDAWKSATARPPVVPLAVRPASRRAGRAVLPDVRRS